MESKELNKKIKQLGKRFLKFRELLNIEVPEGEEEAIRAEFMALYRENSNLTKLNSTSLKIMIKINQSLSILASHRFGLYIDLNELLTPKSKVTS